MTKISLTLKAAGKAFILPAFAVVALTIGSCNKKESMGKAPSASSVNKSHELSNVVAEALHDIAVAKSDAGRTDFSNPAYNYSTYSTPSATVYKWSDPTTGTEFKLSSSSGGGGGLGQLAYNGKSFDYNYVLSIKASSKDPDWDGFMNGRDLRGVVAIDGELTDSDFTLKNLAIFLVVTTGSGGTYKFIDWDSANLGNGDGIGEVLDFSAVPTPNLASVNDAKFFITSGGHIIVSDSEFAMGSDAKVKDVDTQSEYKIEGSIMFE